MKTLINTLLALLSINTIAQTGTIDESFNSGTGFDNIVYESILQDDGKIICVGKFSTYNGQNRPGIARLNTDGSLDATFNPQNGIPTSGGVEFPLNVAIQDDGKILLSGSFKTYNNDTSYAIVRINQDGSIDNTFNVKDSINGSVNCLKIQDDGKILIAGTIDHEAKPTSFSLFRLNSNGSYDDSFDPQGLNFGYILDMELLADGKLVVNTSNEIIRINTDGSPDNSFNNASIGNNAFIMAVAVQKDGKILIGGSFNHLNNDSSVQNLARLNADGTLDNTLSDSSFADVSSIGGYVYDIKVQEDNKIIVGGYLSASKTVNEDTTYRSGVFRFNENGSNDSEFNNSGTGIYPEPGALINNILIINEDDILLSGNFTSFNGEANNRIVQIHAKDNLVSTKNEIDEYSFNLYPNPTSSFIRIESKIEFKRFVIYDNIGKEILTSTSNQIDISNLNSGVYFAKLEFFSGESEVKQIIKK